MIIISPEKLGLLPRDLEQIESALRNFTEIETAVIFGSRALGNFKPGSDIDLLITGQHAGQEIATRLSVVLNEESALPYRLDIIAFQTIRNPKLIEHITCQGILIYQKD